MLSQALLPHFPAKKYWSTEWKGEEPEFRVTKVTSEIIAGGPQQVSLAGTTEWSVYLLSPPPLLAPSASYPHSVLPSGPRVPGRAAGFRVQGYLNFCSSSRESGAAEVWLQESAMDQSMLVFPMLHIPAAIPSHTPHKWQARSP